MCLLFRKIRDFDRGILHQLLVDAYSFDRRWQKCFEADWIAFDSFFFDKPEIADRFGFITTVNGEPIGHISWDPRHRPEYVVIGHNCIASRYKGMGYGKKQLQEAIHRIFRDDVKKIVVTTNSRLVPAQHMYESVGFQLQQKRENKEEAAFSGEYMDYAMNR